eukprot:TRINITY_DN47766_c0_g1_i1.p1 TRINITY_DN47766_c0_g1~~TRINITY_DN47766_c0_g1_i1.p1  ORF type:complete len:452 (-),score=75.69 TRINITY_DN47766_c0_g1_i1:54-1409(-)
MTNAQNLDEFSHRKILNVVLLGLVFMMLASRTPISIVKTVMYSARDTNGTGYVEGFTGDGYVANAVLYATFAMSNFLAPWVISVIGPRYAMLIGGLGYTAYAAQLLYLKDWLLYTCAVLNGVGAALLWTGQGNFLAINSDPKTVGRNASIFWALYQMSGVTGNIAVYLLFQGVQVIEKDTRISTGAALTAMCFTGQVLTLFLRPTPWENQKEKKKTNPIQSFMSCLRLLSTPDIMKLSLSFLYSGFETSFWAGVLPSCIGFTQNLGIGRKGIMGLCSIMVSIGSMTGGLVLAALKGGINRRGRDPVILTGYVLHTFAYFLCFLFLPNLSPFGETTTDSYVTPRMEVLLLVATLMGMGDACLNTQIISILSGAYKERSSEAFALMKLVQSIGVSGGFVMSTNLGLYWQLLVLKISAVLSTIGFSLVEWKIKEKNKETEKTLELQTLKSENSQ